MDLAMKKCPLPILMAVVAICPAAIACAGWDGTIGPLRGQTSGASLFLPLDARHLDGDASIVQDHGIVARISLLSVIDPSRQAGRIRLGPVVPNLSLPTLSPADPDQE